MQLISAASCITMLVLYCTQISQYAIYLENTVRETVTLCKIWNPDITSTVLQNKDIENSEK